MKIRAFLEDEDMIQPGESSQQRLSGEYRRGGGGANFRNRRKGSPIPRHVGGNGKLLQNPNGWYMVSIHHGAKYDKNIIFKLLLNAVSPTVFIPNYHKTETETNALTFYVDEHDTAEKIMRLDRKLELPDGFKMAIRVRGSVPQTKIDESLKLRMKNAMGKRFNQATNALDLSKFHADPELTDIFCALFRPPIMSAAIDIIAENIPNLEALNLNDNKLNLLDHMKSISSKLPNIKILYLGNNRVSTFSTILLKRNNDFVFRSL
jgi:nuclear RNA export factor